MSLRKPKYGPPPESLSDEIMARLSKDGLTAKYIAQLIGQSIYTASALVAATGAKRCTHSNKWRLWPRASTGSPGVGK